MFLNAEWLGRNGYSVGVSMHDDGTVKDVVIQPINFDNSGVNRIKASLARSFPEVRDDTLYQIAIEAFESAQTQHIVALISGPENQRRCDDKSGDKF